MAAQVVSLVASAITQASNLLTRILDATGLLPFYVTMFGVLVTVTYLVSPYIRSAGSDKAKKKSKEE